MSINKKLKESDVKRCRRDRSGRMKGTVEGYATKRYGQRTLLLSIRFASWILRVPYCTVLKIKRTAGFDSHNLEYIKDRLKTN
jgi:hypothetical protein